MVPKLTLEDARIMMDAAEKKAREIGVDVDIAITDDSGNLLMFHRMDNARITSIDIAINKTFTAAAARRPTSAYAETSVLGGSSYGIYLSNQGRFTILTSGLPIFFDHQIVGGIGCSTGSSEQDELIAQAGLNAFLESLKK
jgi:uncharacterized protein GlcG (DUF336 family)